jgi:hypothetical protein
MKKLSIIVLFCSALLLSSCSDDAAPTGNGGGFGGPGGGGGGGNGNVAITVGLIQNQQSGDYYFEFKPSTGVTVTTITGNCAAAGVNNQQIPGDGTTVFTGTDPFYVGPVTNLVASGQQWSFNIKGKIGSSTGTAYDVNASCNVQ